MSSACPEASSSPGERAKEGGMTVSPALGGPGPSLGQAREKWPGTRVPLVFIECDRKKAKLGVEEILTLR